MEEYTIDAKGNKIGRIATEAASVLRGKNRTDFVRNKTPEVTVYITNASEIDIKPEELKQKTYMRYSGYPGGLIKKSAKQVVEKKGYSELVRKAVYGMLPDNRLRKRMMKRLIISD